jgi:hypothetical protein
MDMRSRLAFLMTFILLNACSIDTEKIGMKLSNETSFFTQHNGVEIDGILLPPEEFFKTRSGEHNFSFSGEVNLKDSSKKYTKLSDTFVCPYLLPLCLIDSLADPYIPVSNNCNVSINLESIAGKRYIIDISSKVDINPKIEIYDESSMSKPIVTKSMECVPNKSLQPTAKDAAG